MLYEIFFELLVSEWKFGEICVINIITKAQGRVECNQGWPETCGHSKQVNNLVLLKSIFFKLLPCWTGLAKLFEGTSTNCGLTIGEILSRGET
jgi:hypothetical protein